MSINLFSKSRWKKSALNFSLCITVLVKKGCGQFTCHCCGFFFILDQMKTSETVKKEKMGVFKVLEESSGSNAECVF